MGDGARSARARVPRAVASIVVGGGGLLLGAGLLAADFGAATALVVGICTTWVLVALAALWRASGGRYRGVMMGLGVLALLALTLMGALVLALLALPGEGPPPVAPEWEVRAYRVSIEPHVDDRSESAFLVTERALVSLRDAPAEEWEVGPLRRRVLSREVGFARREVRVMPLQSDSRGEVVLDLSDEGRVRARLCAFTCPVAEVEVQDLPRGAFLEAQGAAAVTRAPFGDSEKVSWSTRDLQDGLRFAYVPAPFHLARVLLTPFIGVASIGALALTGLGLAVGFAIQSIVLPVVLEAVRTRVKGMLVRGA